MSEVGKRAKKLGKTHPRVLRRLEPIRLKVTPKTRGTKPRKCFGFSYEYSLNWWAAKPQWGRDYVWFTTRAGANQAMRKLARDIERARSVMRRGVRKEERT